MRGEHAGNAATRLCNPSTKPFGVRMRGKCVGGVDGRTSKAQEHAPEGLCNGINNVISRRCCIAGEKKKRSSTRRTGAADSR